ncbi:MAG: hypothetical protein AAF250_05250 [Pseudomonadota bacterium]
MIKSTERPNAKTPYTSPQLTIFGQFSKMTAGGSGIDAETSMGDMGAMRRP